MRPHSRIILVAPALPDPQASAGDRQLQEITRLLARDHAVTFVPLRAPSGEEATRVLRALGVRVMPAGTQTVARTLGREAFDYALLQFWHTAEWHTPIIRSLQPWVRILVDTVDVHFARAEAAARVGVPVSPDVTERKQREIASYEQADCLITVTEEDRSVLRHAGVGTPCVVVPLLYRVQQRIARPRQPEALFVGGFAHTPNVDGLLWFARHVWPAVRKTVPNASLSVVGGDAPPEVAALDGQQGIRIVGRVPDTAPYLDAAVVSVAPLRYGAGMKGKVIEAMAAGVPVVTTCFGAQGTGCSHGTELLIAESQEEFARQVVSVLRDPAQFEAMALRAQKRIERLCGEAHVSASLASALSVAGAPARPGRVLFAVQRGVRAARHVVRRVRMKRGDGRRL